MYHLILRALQSAWNRS